MRQIKALFTLLTAVAGMASCSTTSDSDVTLYDDAVITSFTLGTVNRYTVVEAADTTYTRKTTFSGSAYKFTIDQIATADTVDGLSVTARHIYNSDSLPTGSDAAHILCTVATQNNGTAALYNPADSLFYYITDSVDFSRPRLIRVYSSDATGLTDYIVKVNVHQQEGNVFVWTKMDGVAPPVLDTAAAPDGIRQLLGGCTTEQYALSAENQLMVWDAARSLWVKDSIDADSTLLPTSDCSLVSYPMAYAAETDYVLLAGCREEKLPDNTVVTKTAVWRKIVDYGKYAKPAVWAYVERPEDAPYQLPCLKGLTLVQYDDGVLAFGGDSETGAYETIYQSRDNGITWKENALYQMPQDFDYSSRSVRVVKDDDNYIWLFCNDSGQVWRGRLNRLGWAQ